MFRKLFVFFLLLYSVILWLSNLLWYQYENFSQFHWFDDWQEWKQMDKLGHLFSTFHLSSLLCTILGYLLKKKTQPLPQHDLFFFSSFISFLLISSIEILDGFAPNYGASIYDLIANALGAVLFNVQKIYLSKFFLLPKFSFHFTKFATERPNVLGDNKLMQIFKDYNGQTYWYSLPFFSFFGKKHLPKWVSYIHLAIGYSAEEMIFGRVYQNEAIGLFPLRRYFISFDLLFPAFSSKYALINSFIFLLNAIKLPFPTLEWNERDGFIWHWIYF